MTFGWIDRLLYSCRLFFADLVVSGHSGSRCTCARCTCQARGVHGPDSSLLAAHRLTRRR